MATRIKNTVAALAKAGDIVAVIAHRDADCHEPDHEAIADALCTELEAAGVPNVVAAVPAWETEAWIMLFPDAVANYRPCWTKLDIKGRAVGMIDNAKEDLIRRLRSKIKGCRDYKESDAPHIAVKIREMNYDFDLPKKKSKSFSDFIEKFELKINK